MQFVIYSSVKDAIVQKWGYVDYAAAKADDFHNFAGLSPFANCLAWHNGVLSKMDWTEIDDTRLAWEITDQIYEYELIEYFPVPVRLWQGLSDTNVRPKIGKQIIKAFQNAGSVASIRLIEGADHTASNGSLQLVVDEAVAWFKRMEG